MSSDSFNDAETQTTAKEAVSAIDPIRAKIKQAVTDVHEQDSVGAVVHPIS